MASRSIAREWLNGWNTHSVEKVVELYAEDVELHSPEAPQPVRGKNGVRENVRGWIEAFPDVNGDLQTEIRDGPNVAVLLHFSGTHKGALELKPGEPVGATHKKVQMPVAVFLTLDDEERIVKERDVFDLAGMAQQLGLRLDQVTQLAPGQPAPRSR